MNWIKISIFILLTIFMGWCAYGQDILKHAHNDYAQPLPLWNALKCSMHSIEIDIVAYEGRIVVSHDKEELEHKPSIQDLYFKPLTQYLDSIEKEIVLLIDLKTGDWHTLRLLDSIVRGYSSYFKKRTGTVDTGNLQIILSGNFPRDSLRKSVNFPYFFIDGRPEELNRSTSLSYTPWISTNFSHLSLWRGDGILPAEDVERIKALIKQVHFYKSKLRFWNTPDHENVWRELVNLKIDILGTDDPCRLSEYIK